MSTASVIAFAENHHKSTVLVILILTLIAGLIYSVYLGDNLRFGDENIYYAMGSNIVLDGEYAHYRHIPTATRPPGYSAMLAVLMWLGAGIPALRMMNYLALCASLYLVYLILRKQSSFVAGLLGLVVVLAYPVLFYTAGTLYPQTITMALFLWVVHIYFRDRILNYFNMAAIGLLLGALILTAATYAFHLLFLCCWITFDKTKAGFKNASVIVIVTALVITPWIIRNYRVFGSPVFVSTNSGLMLIQGNSEHATPNSGPTADISHYIRRAASMQEDERDRFYRSQAIKYILKDPGHAITLYGMKLLNYFNYRNNLYSKHEESAAKDLVMLLTYGPLLILFALRLLNAHKTPLSRFEFFCALLYLLNGVVSAVFYTRIRYRIPFDPLLICVVVLYLCRAHTTQAKNLPTATPTAEETITDLVQSSPE